VADRASAAHERHDSELVPGCRECDALAPDLAAISLSLASLRGGIQTGHRDFRISATDAQRLRRGRGIRAWLRPVAGRGFAFARPLGGTLTVVALVGLLASSLPQGLAAGGAAYVSSQESGQSRDHTTEPPRALASPSAVAAFDTFSGSPKAPDPNANPTSASQATVAPGQLEGPVVNTPATPTAQSGIFLASVVLLPIGLLLVFGRGLARRLIGPAREP
jgi:hypothetical protein